MSMGRKKNMRKRIELRFHNVRHWHGFLVCHFICTQNTAIILKMVISSCIHFIAVDFALVFNLLIWFDVFLKLKRFWDYSTRQTNFNRFPWIPASIHIAEYSSTYAAFHCERGGFLEIHHIYWISNELHSSYLTHFVVICEGGNFSIHCNHLPFHFFLLHSQRWFVNGCFPTKKKRTNKKTRLIVNGNRSESLLPSRCSLWDEFVSQCGYFVQ